MESVLIFCPVASCSVLDWASPKVGLLTLTVSKYSVTWASDPESWRWNEHGKEESEWLLIWAEIILENDWIEEQSKWYLLRNSLSQLVRPSKLKVGMERMSFLGYQSVYLPSDRAISQWEHFYLIKISFYLRLWVLGCLFIHFSHKPLNYPFKGKLLGIMKMF